MNLMLFRVVVARLLTLAKTVSAAECINCDLIVVVVDVVATACSRCYANGSSRFYSFANTILSICLGCVPS